MVIGFGQITLGVEHDGLFRKRLRHGGRIADAAPNDVCFLLKSAA
jgi:hypothetical protein